MQLAITGTVVGKKPCIWMLVPAHLTIDSSTSKHPGLHWLMSQDYYMSTCVRKDLLKRLTWMVGIEWYRHDLDDFSSLASFCFQRSNVVKTNVFVSWAPTHSGCLGCPPRVGSSTRAKVEHWGELIKLVAVVHFHIRHRKELTFVGIQLCCCCSWCFSRHCKQPWC